MSKSETALFRLFEDETAKLENARLLLRLFKAFGGSLEDESGIPADRCPTSADTASMEWIVQAKTTLLSLGYLERQTLRGGEVLVLTEYAKRILAGDYFNLTDH